MMVKIGVTTKGHRIWLQGLRAKGYPIGSRYNVTYGDGWIRVTIDPNGRKAIGSPSKGGVIDLCSQSITQWAKGADKVMVSYFPESIYMEAV